MSKSNPFDGKFNTRFAGVQAEFANDLCRVLAFEPILAEKLAVDIANDFGRIESAQVKGVKIGAAKKSDRMMDIKVTLEAVKGLESLRLSLYRTLQELRRVQVETGIKYGEITLSDNVAELVANERVKIAEMAERGEPWMNPALKAEIAKAEKQMTDAKIVNAK